MTRALELISAIAQGGGSLQAQRWAQALSAEKRATPVVIDTLARAPDVTGGPSLGWHIATVAGIAVAGLATARALFAMNAQRESVPWLPWWLPLVVVVPALAAVLTPTLRARSGSRQARFQAAAQLGLNLLRHEVPAELAIDVAAFVYELDSETRARLSGTSDIPGELRDASSPAKRAAIALATHAHAGVSAAPGPGLASVVATSILAILSVLFLLVYLDVLDASLLAGRIPSAPGAKP